MKTVNTRGTALAGAFVLTAATIGVGCAASPPCRQGPKDDVTVAGRTAGDAVKTGAQTGVEGVKSAGKAVRGAWEGGREGASTEWNEGKADTRATANSGAEKTRSEADVPPCR